VGALLRELLGQELDERLYRGERPEAAEYHRRLPNYTTIIDALFAAAMPPTSPAELGRNVQVPKTLDALLDASEQGLGHSPLEDSDRSVPRPISAKMLSAARALAPSPRVPLVLLPRSSAAVPGSARQFFRVRSPE
jgi:hypothetical protein